MDVALTISLPNSGYDGRHGRGFFLQPDFMRAVGEIAQQTTRLAPKWQRVFVKLAQPIERGAIVWLVQPLEKVKLGSLMIAQAGRVRFGNIENHEPCHRHP